MDNFITDRKKVLYVGFGIFAFLSLLGVLAVLTDAEYDSFLRMGTSSIHITSLILFVYAMDKDKNNICKYGICLIGVSFVLALLREFGFYDYSTYTFIDRFFSLLYNVCGSLVSICYVIILFGLMKSDDEKIKSCKKICILAAVFVILLSILSFILPNVGTKFVSVLSSVGNSVYSFTEYAVIILYLLNKFGDTPIQNGQVVASSSVQNNGGGQQVSVVNSNQSNTSDNGTISQSMQSQSTSSFQPPVNAEPTIEQSIPVNNFQPPVDIESTSQGNPLNNTSLENTQQN